MSKKSKNRDELLIAGLLSKDTVRAAARVAGMSERSAYRRKRDPEFERQFAEAKRELVHAAMTKVTSNSGLAAATLKKIFLDRKASASARVSAAQATLRLTVEFFEVSQLEARIRALEESRHEAL